MERIYLLLVKELSISEVVVTFCFFNQTLFRPDVSELESKLSEQSKILLNLQQKVDDLASKVY